jgi:hypothetical protein
MRELQTANRLRNANKKSTTAQTHCFHYFFVTAFEATAISFAKFYEAS